MINRYTVKKINSLWTRKNILDKWLKIELLVVEELEKLNLFSKKTLNEIKSSCTVDVELMDEIEKKTNHDIVAFLKMLNTKQQLSHKWLHFGLTSGDITETTNNLLIKESLELIKSDYKKLLTVLKEKSLKYKNTLIMGRTHGVYAEPMSLGLKFALWYDELNRELKLLNDAINDSLVIKISGSLGNFTHVSPIVQENIAKKLKLKFSNINSQIISRDRLIHLFSIISNISTTIEKIAIEIRIWQKTEVNEASEPFLSTQTGSSSLPHKKNPILCENICGLARLIRSNSFVLFNNNLLWNERDISNSSNERVIFPDNLNLFAFIIIRISKVLENLNVNEEQIKKNILTAKRIYFSQPLMLKLIKDTNQTREEIYKFIQKTSFICRTKNQDYYKVLKENNINQWYSDKELNDFFNHDIFLKHLDYFYKKIFNT